MLLGKRKKKVLVADDDGDFLRVTRALLEHAGFVVDTAEDGEQALKALKKRKYDLLILDVVMPKVDGIKLFQMARKSKRYSKISVLLISGQTSREALAEQEREIADKADGFMEKPIKTKAFMEKVKTLVDKHG
jgi:CheY-like chemotaxis protein